MWPEEGLTWCHWQDASNNSVTVILFKLPSVPPLCVRGWNIATAMGSSARSDCSQDTSDCPDDLWAVSKLLLPVGQWGLLFQEVSNRSQNHENHGTVRMIASFRASPTRTGTSAGRLPQKLRTG
jgi:hypothetical protein